MAQVELLQVRVKERGAPEVGLAWRLPKTLPEGLINALRQFPEIAASQVAQELMFLRIQEYQVSPNLPVRVTLM